MIKKINNIKLMLEMLGEDMATNNVNTMDILKISQQLEEIIKKVTILEDNPKETEKIYNNHLHIK